MLQYCCLVKFPKSCLQLSAGIDSSVILECLIFHFLNGFSSLCHSVIFALLIISGMKNTMPVPLSFAEWGWTCIVTFGVGLTSWSGICKCFVLCKWFQRQSTLIFLQRTETIFFFFIHKGHILSLLSAFIAPHNCWWYICLLCICTRVQHMHEKYSFFATFDFVPYTFCHTLMPVNPFALWICPRKEAFGEYADVSNIIIPTVCIFLPKCSWDIPPKKSKWQWDSFCIDFSLHFKPIHMAWHLCSGFEHVCICMLTLILDLWCSVSMPPAWYFLANNIQSRV